MDVILTKVLTRMPGGAVNGLGLLMASCGSNGIVYGISWFFFGDFIGFYSFLVEISWDFVGFHWLLLVVI